MPEILAIWPIPAVMAIPRHPPINTRTVGANTFEPEILALTTPVKTKPQRVNPTMLHALAPRVGAKAPANGIKPPHVKAMADAIAA